MRRTLNFAIVFFTAFTYLSAQHLDWDMQGARQVSTSLQNLSPLDRRGIAKRLGEKPANLRAMQIDSASGHLFIVQGTGDNCSPTGNCSTWALNSDYKVLLSTIAQTIKIQPSKHDGQPDILTAMHGSAFSGGMKQWHFEGSAYRNVACAEYSYWDVNGKVLKHAKTAIELCSKRQ
jgi:hypothetical protein